LETRIGLSCVVVLGTSSREKESVVHVVAVVTWNGRRREIVGLVAGVGCVSDLKRVSVECDEVVEKRNDCLMESGDAHEICHDDLLGHDCDHHLERICLAHGGVVETSVSCLDQYQA
jgi:hypothetical protein